MSRATSWLLNAVYTAALVLFAPRLLWSAWRKGKHREGFAEKLLGKAPKRKGNRYCVWVHAVSVGEVNLVGVLLEELRRRHPKWEVCVSTTSKTGYQLARRKYRRHHAVFYCPLDFTWAVRRAARRVRPDLLVLAELELWPNLIAAVKQRGAKVAIVNGRLSERSFQGYRRVASLTQRVLRQVDLVAAQDEATAGRFRALGAPAASVRVTGSLKYDGAQTDRGNPRTEALRKLADFAPEDRVWIAGSTQAPEEEICLREFLELRQERPELKLVLVPRHPERFDEVAFLVAETGLAWARRSSLTEESPRGDDADVLLVDSVGELGAWWGLADVGFVGGSFGDRGGQNMIEPAAYGVPTSFGPNTRNFRDIVAALVAADGARVVPDAAGLSAFVAACLEMPFEAAALGHRARKFVASQLGATARTADLVDALSGEVAEAAATTRRAA